jgi:acyl carrier protein
MQPPAFSAPACGVGAASSETTEMLDRTDTPADRIAALINRMLSERSLRFPAVPDDDLRSLGFSSLDMVNLVLAVESEFDVSIPDADITPARFRSIATIAALVTALLPSYETTT